MLDAQGADRAALEALVKDIQQSTPQNNPVEVWKQFGIKARTYLESREHDGAAAADTLVPRVKPITGLSAEAQQQHYLYIHELGSISNARLRSGGVRNPGRNFYDPQKENVFIRWKTFTFKYGLSNAALSLMAEEHADEFSKYPGNFKSAINSLGKESGPTPRFFLAVSDNPDPFFQMISDHFHLPQDETSKKEFALHKELILEALALVDFTIVPEESDAKAKRQPYTRGR